MEAIKEYTAQEIAPTAISIIESVDLTRMQRQVQAITDFQELVHSQFRQDHDFGVIPGTKKPTLLKPGAERLLMLLGLTSEFQVIDQTRDFENGFFQYLVKCIVKKDNNQITDGFGSCNTKERKYIRQDPYTMDNTVLKMAKKRALVDAALMVGALSDIFTQDIEDMDLNRQSYRQARQRTYTDRDGTITKQQAQEIFDAAGGDEKLVREVMKEFGYKNSQEIKKTDFQSFLLSVVEKVNERIYKMTKAAVVEKEAKETEAAKDATTEDPPIEDLDDLPDFLKDEGEEDEQKE
jgi:hypothetical protein